MFITKLKTIKEIYRGHRPGRASAICAGILCRKFSYRHSFGTINLLLLKKTFKDATAALKELDIPFVLAYGTVLGIRRSGELLKYDDDIDFAIFQGSLMHVSADPDKRDQRINSVMKKHAFEPLKKGATPWYHAPDKWSRVEHVPMLYQYIHALTHVTFDIYVFAKHDGHFWSYGAGGRRFPITSIKRTNYNNEDHLIFPDKWLALMYGDWKIAKRKGQYEPNPSWGMPPPRGIPPFDFQ